MVEFLAITRAGSRTQAQNHEHEESLRSRNEKWKLDKEIRKESRHEEEADKETAGEGGGQE